MLRAYQVNFQNKMNKKVANLVTQSTIAVKINMKKETLVLNLLIWMQTFGFVFFKYSENGRKKTLNLQEDLTKYRALTNPLIVYCLTTLLEDSSGYETVKSHLNLIKIHVLFQ